MTDAAKLFLDRVRAAVRVKEDENVPDPYTFSIPNLIALGMEAVNWGDPDPMTLVCELHQFGYLSWTYSVGRNWRVDPQVLPTLTFDPNWTRAEHTAAAYQAFLESCAARGVV